MAERTLGLGGRSGLIHRVATACRELTGWRRLLLAFALGALAVAALPPFHLIVVIWPAFVGLLWLLDGVTRVRGAFVLGWAFGCGHFLAGLYWVGIAFLVDAERYAAAVPFAVSGLSAGLAVFPGIALALVQVSRTTGAARVFTLAAAWLFTEWLRSWTFTGFPWNLIGTVWAGSEAMLQSASLFGVWGLSAFSVLIAASPALLAGGQVQDGRVAGGSSAAMVSRWAPLWLPAVVLALVWGGGTLRLASALPESPDPSGNAMLRLVQPSIPQRLKWREDHRTRTLSQLIELSLRPGFDRITHVIWPETAVPYDLSNSEKLRGWLAVAAPKGGGLITGAPRRAKDDGQLKIFNSLHALEPSGRLRATYDKVHLVPFGEYVPFGDYLRFSKLTAGRLDFSAGGGPTTLSVPGLPPFGPLICYEVIFPGAVTSDDQRPDFLLTVTNDAWFGESTGPFQHFAAARFRAVEEGLPMVRAANNGISGVIDGYGRVKASLGTNKVGIIDIALPGKVEQRTTFSKIGNWSVLLLLFVLIIPAGIATTRRADGAASP